MASHFDSSGTPDGWSDRNAFYGLYLSIVIMIIAVFHWYPVWCTKHSKIRLKVPSPEYWLAPERIEQTRLFFRNQMALIGILHLLLTITAIQLVIEANLKQAIHLDQSLTWVLALYFLLLAGWLIQFFRHFRSP